MSGPVLEIARHTAHLAVAGLAFTTGLGAASAHGRALWKKRGVLARSLFAVMVAVPLLAVLLVKLLNPPLAVGVGMLLIAIAIGPVMALRKAHGTNDDYALGLNVVLLCSSLVFVPLAVWAIGAAFERDLGVSVGTVARVVLPLQLVPLVIGVGFGRFAPALARRLEKPLSKGMLLLILLLVAVLAVVLFKPLLALGARGLGAIAALAAGAVAMGHVLGGDEPEERRVLVAFSTMRFPALALALVSLTQASGKDVLPVLLAYLIFAAIFVGLYRALTRPTDVVTSPGATGAPS